METQRIGLMGGSFNPIHQAHILMARMAMREAALDKVLFIPTGSPPHKREGLAPAAQRMWMVRMAVARETALIPSDIEMNRNGMVYTVDTLMMLKSQMPNALFYYIIGEDTLYDLIHWRSPEKVFQMCRFLVCPRPGAAQGVDVPAVTSELKRLGADYSYLSGEAGDISSTAIRRQLQNGEEPEGILPAVMEYIRVMGLFGVTASPAGFAAQMDKLSSSMGFKRFVHTLCVAYAARRLARLHGEDEEKAALAGLLHDCAKGMDLGRMQEYIKKLGIKVDKDIFASGSLLHAVAGAQAARLEYGVRDSAVLSAIENHTLGNVPMSRLDMIVCLADKIEPDRENYPGLDEVRRLAQTDLADALLLSFERTESYVKERGNAPHPATARTVKWLRSLKNKGIDTKEETV